MVSVVIVNFNSGSALKSTLDALSDGMVGVEWETVVVDNASADGSERVAEGVGRTRLVRLATNTGFARGMNAGINVSSGSYVLVLNPDCRLKPGSGRLLLDELQNHKGCAVIGPGMLDSDGTLQESARGDPSMLTGLFGRSTIGSRLFPRLGPVRRNLLSASLANTAGSSHVVDWISGACMLARRDALAGADGFDERYFLYWEDADLCRRLRNAGWEIRYMPSAAAVHDVGRSSQTVRALANREFHRSAYRYFATYVVPQKWHPGRLAAWAILRLRSVVLGVSQR